jgi:hypothetical protein
MDQRREQTEHRGAAPHREAVRHPGAGLAYDRRDGASVIIRFLFAAGIVLVSNAITWFVSRWQERTRSIPVAVIFEAPAVAGEGSAVMFDGLTVKRVTWQGPAINTWHSGGCA